MHFAWKVAALMALPHGAKVRIKTASSPSRAVIRDPTPNEQRIGPLARKTCEGGIDLAAP
jgi:hypothetical protein